MPTNKPIYSIAKELGTDANNVLSACKTLGISAKGSTKRLNRDELEKILNYFNTGKNASIETVDIETINSSGNEIKVKNKKPKEISKITYFPNRLIS